MKYVLVSGGVISGIGKGIIASSTGLLLKTKGLKVTSIKIDPYINIDAGTMAPTEHGEVFVLDDGGEVDLDLGNYERYLNVTLTRENNITTGKMYQALIEKERRGDYLGRTVQIVPHLTDFTQDWIERVARVPVDETNEEPDACIIELGGTVGDIESGPFTEVMRQLRRRAGKNNFLHIHVSLVPIINGEQKTKPTQQAIRDVRQTGLSPDLIACRCNTVLEKSVTDKIAMFCQVEPEQVVVVHDVPSTYRVPVVLKEQGLISRLQEILQLDALGVTPQMQDRGQQIWRAWNKLTDPNEHVQAVVKIALVGKYKRPNDSYLSVIKSLEHAAMACGKRLELIWVNASDLEEGSEDSKQGSVQEKSATFDKAWHDVRTAHGILVPGGFGLRGTEGMIAAARWARENKTPYLGICLGMQIAVIEYARYVCNIPNAGSEEWEEKPAAAGQATDKVANAAIAKDAHSPATNITDKIIIKMLEFDPTNLGGTMRLGIRDTHFQQGSEWSKLRALYSLSKSRRVLTPSLAQKGNYISTSSTTDALAPVILERHRHRYEVNPAYIEQLSQAGLPFVGKDSKGERMEIVELKDHPWFVGVQFHPEYLSRVLEPSRPYLGFVAASAGCLEEVMARLKGQEEMVNGISDDVNGLGI